jgi:hypothetical protein
MRRICSASRETAPAERVVRGGVDGRSDIVGALVFLAGKLKSPGKKSNINLDRETGREVVWSSVVV